MYSNIYDWLYESLVCSDDEGKVTIPETQHIRHNDFIQFYFFKEYCMCSESVCIRIYR